MCEGCLKGVQRVSEGCLKVFKAGEWRRVCEGCVKGVLRVCEGCVKGV